MHACPKNIIKNKFLKLSRRGLQSKQIIVIHKNAKLTSYSTLIFPSRQVWLIFTHTFSSTTVGYSELK